MAETKTDAPASKNRLYVKWDFNEQSLRQVFEAFGTVTDAHAIRGMRQRSDYGFVTFKDEAEAAKAMAALQGKTLTSGPLQLEYSQSEKPRERKLRAPREKGESKRPERRERVKRDYADLKAITLNPNPVKDGIPTSVEELKSAGDERLFRSGRQEAQKGEMIGGLAFKPKQGHGDLNASIAFQVGNLKIGLKVASITVKTKADDIRVAATIVHPDSGRQADVYLRHFKDEQGVLQIRHKFLELRDSDLNPAAYQNVDESKVDPNQKVDCYFVALEKIVLDRVSGLWSELHISLHRTKVLRRPARQEPAAGSTERPRRRFRRGGSRRGGRRDNAAGASTTTSAAPGGASH